MNRATVQALLDANSKTLGEVSARSFQSRLNALGDMDHNGFADLHRAIARACGGTTKGYQTKEARDYGSR